MPRAVTLVDVVPVMWNALHMGECERIRTLTRAGFNRIMDKNNLALTSKVRDRVWKSFVDHGLAEKSYTVNALDFDTVKFRNFILDEGLEDEIENLGAYQSGNTHIHTYDTHTTHIREGAQ